jgi:hypothetical protein
MYTIRTRVQATIKLPKPLVIWALSDLEIWTRFKKSRYKNLKAIAGYVLR